MKRIRWTVTSVALIAFALLAGGCGGSSGEEAVSEPARVESGGGVTKVVLSADAAKLLGVETAPVHAAAGGKRLIPFAAVLYDPNGKTWTYTSPKPLVFVRRDIRVDRIDGERAILSAGPPTGTPVVTVGATEIWGVEYGGIEED